MDARSFLVLRRSGTPEALHAHLMAGAPEADAVRGLSEQALAELARSRTAAGRVRASAWHLLAADALLTYACEAALDGADPPRAFADLLRTAATGEA